MIKFSAPDDNSIKAVIIDKNRKIGKRFLIYTSICLLITAVYALIAFLTKDFSVLSGYFLDFGLSSCILLTVLVAFVGVFITFRPVLKREVANNGHYGICVEQNGVKITFEEGTEVFVPKSKLGTVTETENYFVISCFNNKDEIVCQKDKLIEGNINELFEIFSTDYGVSRIKKQSTGKFSKFLFWQKNGSAILAILFAFLSVLVTFPCAWFTLKASINVVPKVLNTVVGVVSNVALFLQIVLGLILLPIGIILTILAGVSALVIMFLPIILLVFATYFTAKQIRTEKNWFSAICLFVLIVAILLIVYFVSAALWH